MASCLGSRWIPQHVADLPPSGRSGCLKGSYWCKPGPATLRSDNKVLVKGTEFRKAIDEGVHDPFRPDAIVVVCFLTAAGDPRRGLLLTFNEDRSKIRSHSYSTASTDPLHCLPRVDPMVASYACCCH